ncbi:MAG: histidine kinase dimerization/phosphoacceptor domain -containing protein, partial [Microcystaceae cyanobacterium]
QQGQVQIVNDIYEMNFLECYIEFLEQLQIRSSINLPLLNNSKLWGLLSIHQFAQPRTWQDSEIDLLKQITDQLAIAIQQANLYQQAQQELAAKNKLFLQLTNELDQKKILLKDIHHRVKNNLQIMASLSYLQFSKASPEIQLLSEDYQNRIQSMALIHEQLYRSEDLSEIDFNAYLLNLTNNIFQSYNINPDLIKLTLNVDKIVINLDQSVPLGLITHELVSNALKHAFPTGQGDIAISLICSASELILRVADNGMGISPDIDLQNTDSLGMQLIYSLTEQLQGQVHYTYQAGSHFEIIFPCF